MPAMTTHEQALATQSRRAARLAAERRCPHCRAPITLFEAVSMVRGHGTIYYVKIALPNGHAGFVEEREFNPQTMLWADHHEPKQPPEPNGGRGR